MLRYERSSERWVTKWEKLIFAATVVNTSNKCAFDTSKFIPKASQLCNNVGFLYGLKLWPSIFNRCPFNVLHDDTGAASLAVNKAVEDHRDRHRSVFPDKLHS